MHDDYQAELRKNTYLSHRVADLMNDSISYQNKIDDITNENLNSKNNYIQESRNNTYLSQRIDNLMIDSMSFQERINDMSNEIINLKTDSIKSAIDLYYCNYIRTLGLGGHSKIQLDSTIALFDNEIKNIEGNYNYNVGIIKKQYAKDVAVRDSICEQAISRKEQQVATLKNILDSCNNEYTQSSKEIANIYEMRMQQMQQNHDANMNVLKKELSDSRLNYDSCSDCYRVASLSYLSSYYFINSTQVDNNFLSSGVELNLYPYYILGVLNICDLWIDYTAPNITISDSNNPNGLNMQLSWLSTGVSLRANIGSIGGGKADIKFGVGYFKTWGQIDNFDSKKINYQGLVLRSELSIGRFQRLYNLEIFFGLSSNYKSVGDFSFPTSNKLVDIDLGSQVQFSFNVGLRYSFWLLPPDGRL